MSEQPNTISKARKKQLISLTVLFLGNLKNFNQEKIAQSVGANEQDKEFLDEVYHEIIGTVKEGYLTMPEKESLKATLLNKFGISNNLEQEVKGQEAKEEKSFVEPSQEKGPKPMNINTTDIEKALEEKEIREDLYSPNSLCGKPELKDYRKISPERIQEHSYEFNNQHITIRTTGMLVFKSSPEMQESMYQYEITKQSADGKSMVMPVVKFGAIDFDKMEDIKYKYAVLIGLLADVRLQDSSLHGYLGELSPTKDENGELNYNVQYSSLEYTAVLAYEQQQNEKNQIKNNIANFHNPNSNVIPFKEEGGEAR